jgi:putative ABC transport system permease protein
MIDLALGNLRKRKLRSILCILGITISVFLLSTVDGMLGQMHAEIHRDLDRLEGKMFLQQKGSNYPPFASTLNQSIVNEVLDQTYVNKFESTPLLMTVLEPADNPRDVAQVFAVGFQQGKETVYFKNAKAKEGFSLLEGQPENAIILGSEAQRFYDAKIWSNIYLHGVECYVVGILESQKISLVDQGIFMSLSFCQSIFGRSEQISAVLITINDMSKTDELVAALESEYPSLETITDEEINKSLKQSLEMPDRFMSTIYIVVFLATCIMIMNVMVMAVRERTKEIGTLRAIGSSKSTVLKIILYETVLLTLSGGIFGIILTFILAQPPLLNWAWILSVEETIKIIGVICLISLLSVLFPAYLASKVDPLEALRYE